MRQRDEFLALLGHELRNPLGAMRNAATLAERAAAAVPGLDRPLVIIDRQLRHLTQLVDDLLDVARVTSGKMALKLVPVDLAGLTRAMVEEMEKTSRERRLLVELRVPDDRLLVMGDPVRLEQIFNNMLTNALKYTPAHGRIDVSVEPRSAGRPCCAWRTPAWGSVPTCCRRSSSPSRRRPAPSIVRRAESAWGSAWCGAWRACTAARWR